MLIVDAQVHLWANNVPANPGHRQIPDFTADDLLKEMDEGGIDAAIIHPPSWDPNSDNLALEAARSHPNRLSILGKIPLEQVVCGKIRDLPVAGIGRDVVGPQMHLRVYDQHFVCLLKPRISSSRP